VPCRVVPFACSPTITPSKHRWECWLARIRREEDTGRASYCTVPYHQPTLLHYSTLPNRSTQTTNSYWKSPGSNSLGRHGKGSTCQYSRIPWPPPNPTITRGCASHIHLDRDTSGRRRRRAYSLQDAPELISARYHRWSPIRI
jgi:hypothetical protein